MKPKKILMLALLSGIITTVIFYLFMEQARSSSGAEEAATVSIIAASEDIQQNQEITEDQLTVIEVDENEVHPQSVEDKAKVVGKLAATEIKAGEQLMSHRVQSGEEEDEVIALKITEGHRAFSINIDYVKSVSNMVEPEDYVDVVLSVGKEEATKTELIQEKVRVLAVGRRMVEKKQDAPEEEYHAVTLELSQEDTVKVINASERGRLQLSLYSKRVSEEKDIDEIKPNKVSSNLNPLPQRSAIRSGPGLDEAVITVVDQGTILRDLEQDSTDEQGRIWLNVETPDQQEGWISSRIVKYEAE
ncbi:pilus assembly protein CpaB [Thalassobacillus cyri]|uniref:Pilus assembly protein CpaB n=1 Tax=Thalassobacillus cyri TaxID=571932 RepID=A0A1H4EGZ3_9BACI|nr:Flp pilus assembly protein CpaB [Thalassobacillus cyri]SEA83860.1 pilus assembly protein CpaB [Thalassobacillus cyri]